MCSLVEKAYRKAKMSLFQQACMKHMQLLPTKFWRNTGKRETKSISEVKIMWWGRVRKDLCATSLKSEFVDWKPQVKSRKSRQNNSCQACTGEWCGFM